jgi:hypothetical protein
VDGDALTSFRPDDGTHFGVAVTASVGWTGAKGGDYFQFEVCSPSWVAAQTLQKGFAFQRLLVVESWNPEVIHRAISDLCARDWAEVASKLSRYSLWEFEDYQEYQGG